MSVLPPARLAEKLAMKILPLAADNRPALEAFLMGAPVYNVFHLSALAEYGPAGNTNAYSGVWATGAFRGGELVGAVLGFRGIGGTYCAPGDEEVLQALSRAVLDRCLSGALSLLSGHASQLDPLLPMIGEAGIGRIDRCHFRTLSPHELVLPAMTPVEGFTLPRLAGPGDMERLIDFYEVGFYSLAHLPSRAAWRSRLSEQLAFRTLFLIDDRQGRVASAALTSAEAGGVAMIGGVATRQEYRGLGLSTMCVGALCRYLFDTGITCVALFYVKDNHPAAHVYDRLGFRYDGEWLLVPLGYPPGMGFAAPDAE